MGYSRRNFIENSVTATTALFLASLDVFGSPLLKSEKATAGFSLKIMAPYWGFNGSVTDFCKKARQEGYDGVEILWSPSIAKELLEALIPFTNQPVADQWAINVFMMQAWRKRYL